MEVTLSYLKLLFCPRCEDYNGDADVSEDVDVDLEHLRHAVRLPRSVHFEDILDDSAPGRMKSIRRKLGAETKTARAKAEVNRNPHLKDRF